MILTLALMMSMAGALSAQGGSNAIGIRFGYGAEISYQRPFGKENRLEADLGFNGGGASLSGIYQWVWDLSKVTPGLKWYAGAGATLGVYSSDFSVGAVGQIGTEYNFKEIPLQLSLDYRPSIFVIPSVSGSYDGICLAARYKF